MYIFNLIIKNKTSSHLILNALLLNSILILKKDYIYIQITLRLSNIFHKLLFLIVYVLVNINSDLLLIES